jgi:hypothetical protein
VPVNRGDELLNALRTRLVSVATLPAVRAWQNTNAGVISPTVSSVEDRVITFDTRRREVGPTAGGRTEVTYRVTVRVPKGTDTHSALAIAVAIQDAFTGATLTVGGNLVTLEDSRVGPEIADSQFLTMPVYLSLTFDHT